MTGMLEFFNRAVRPLANKVKMLAARGILSAVDDAQSIQKVQCKLLAGEVKDGIENLQQFGFASRPPTGSIGAIIFPMGNRDHGLCVATQHKDSRPGGLESGETRLFTSDGTEVRLLLGGKIQVVNGTDEMVANISNWMQAHIDGRTLTALGPMPHISLLPNETFPQIKARHDTFKKV